MENAVRKETVVADIPLCPPGLHLSCLREIQEGNMSEVDQSQILTVLTRIMDKLDGTNGTPGMMTRMRVAEGDITEIKKDIGEINACLKQMGIDEQAREKAREQGALTRAKEVRDERRNAWWYKLMFHAITVGVTLILAALFQTYVNKAPSVTDKKIVETEAQKQTADEERFARIEKTLITIAERLPETKRSESNSRNKPVSKPSPAPPPAPPAPTLLQRNHEEGVIANPAFRAYSSARINSREGGF